MDLFSGAGGSALGFVRAGLELVGALDLDAHATRTFRENLGLEPLSADAATVDFASWSRELGDVDVLVGCPPCQGFSRMRNTHLPGAGDDPRNRLVYAYVRAVRALRPRVVVFENVPWMARTRGGGYLRDLVTLLSKLGYRLTWGILDAADYGVPQHRKRLIVVGSARSEPSLPEPTHADPGSRWVGEGLRRPWRTVREAIADLPPLGHGEEDPSVPNHVARRLPENWLRLIRAIPKDGGSRSQAPRSLWLPCHRRHRGHYDVFGRLWWGRPSNTITTGCWNPSKGRFVHPEQDRGLSLRECARLQGFPDDFVFHGPPTAVSRQIGNAMPPPLATAIASRVREDFF